MAFENGIDLVDIIIPSFHSVQEIFEIWSSANPQPMLNILLQSLGLDLVNINVSANFIKIFHTIVMGIFRKLSGDKIFANCPGTKSSQLSGDGHCDYR